MSRVLVVGDLHAPFNHVNALRFLKDLQKEYQTDKVVFIGDLVDNHALSRFDADPDGYSPGDEWKKTLKELHRFYRAFPEATWIEGNHDRRPFIKAKKAGIPEKILHTLKEIYEAPKGWDVTEKITIDGVDYVHGEASGGNSNWQDYCKKHGKNVVFGHLHGVAGVRFHELSTGLMWSCATGCLVDKDTYAMAYGKYFPVQPVLSSAIVIDGKLPIVVPMDLTDRKYSRIRRNL